MAIDKIKPLKIETPEDGTQNDFGYTTEVNPSEDYIAAKGIAFENNENYTIDIVSGQLAFKDTTSGLRLMEDFLSEGSSDPNALDILFYAYDANGNLDISGSWTDITFDTEERKDSSFTHTTGSAEITINNNAWYEVTGEFTAATDDTDRDSAEWKLQKDSGSGYQDVPGTTAWTYHRTTANGEDSTSITSILELNNGDKIKFQGYGYGSVQTVANGCRIFIRVLDRNGSYDNSLWEQVGVDIHYSSGNVGIGTSSPNALLEIGGEARLSDASDMGGNDSSLATKKYVDDNAGGGLTEEDHRNLDQLVHTISEDNYYELTYSGNKITSAIYYTDSSKTTKIREETYTYTNNKVSKLETKQYDSSGVLVEIYTEYFNYSGNTLISSSGVLT